MDHITIVKFTDLKRKHKHSPIVLCNLLPTNSFLFKSPIFFFSVTPLCAITYINTGREREGGRIEAKYWRKMPIEMPKGLQFSVDTWTPFSRRKRHHFLTHAHKDHSQGIITYASYPVYSTSLTKTLLLQNYPQVTLIFLICSTIRYLIFYKLMIYCWIMLGNMFFLGQLDESLFVDIEVGQSLIVKDPDCDFTVTAFDANHCPGMYFFFFLIFITM